MAELLLNFVEKSKQSLNKQKSDDEMLNEMFLFPGDSCFPLSPLINTKTNLSNTQNKKKVSCDDQLVKILKILGSPTLEDFSFLNDSYKLKYVQKLA